MIRLGKIITTVFSLRINHIFVFTHFVSLSCICSSQEGIVERLFKWAQEAEQPLRIYATGLLAGAMENQDIAANYREENSVLVSRGYLLSQMFNLMNDMKVSHKVFHQ